MARYADLIDRIDGFTVGNLIIDGGVFLETTGGEVISINTAKSIEILNGDEYYATNVDECLSRVTEQGWPLFAGLYTRVRL